MKSISKEMTGMIFSREMKECRLPLTYILSKPVHGREGSEDCLSVENIQDQLSHPEAGKAAKP